MVFFSELSRVMGLRSENAQRAPKKCSNHHKTLTVLQIVHEWTLQELMVTYVRKFMLMNDVFTLSWISKVHDDGGHISKLYVFRDHDLDVPGSTGR